MSDPFHTGANPLTPADDLPALPESDGYVSITPSGSVIVPPHEFGKSDAVYKVFTAAQMRAYALAARAERDVEIERLKDQLVFREKAVDHNLQAAQDAEKRAEAADDQVAQRGAEIEQLREALKETNAEDKRDAARWRALRNWPFAQTRLVHGTDWPTWGPGTSFPKAGDVIDAWIDGYMVEMRCRTAVTVTERPGLKSE